MAPANGYQSSRTGSGTFNPDMRKLLSCKGKKEKKNYSSYYKQAISNDVSVHCLRAAVPAWKHGWNLTVGYGTKDLVMAPQVSDYWVTPSSLLSEYLTSGHHSESLCSSRRQDKKKKGESSKHCPLDGGVFALDVSSGMSHLFPPRCVVSKQQSC